jgi:hypothetical protein
MNIILIMGSFLIINNNNNYNKEQDSNIIKQHDRLCAHICFTTCKEIGIKLDKEHWYEHASKSVEMRHERK